MVRGAETPKHKSLCFPCRGGPGRLGCSLCPLPRSASFHGMRTVGAAGTVTRYMRSLGGEARAGGPGHARLRPPPPRPARPFLLGSSPASGTGDFPRQAPAGCAHPENPRGLTVARPPHDPLGASSLLPTRGQRWVAWD